MLVLKLAELDDEAAVLAMARAFHLEDGHPLKESSPGAIRALLAGSPLGQIYLVQKAGHTIGYCALCFTMSLEFGGVVVILDDLFILQPHRGQGAGRAVLARVQEIAREKGAVQLFLEVENANERAFKLYESIGFRKRDRHMMDKRF